MPVEAGTRVPLGRAWCLERVQYDSSASCPSGRRPGSERDLCVRGEKRVEVRTRDTRVEGYWEMRGGATRDVNRLALELLVCEFDVT